MCGVLTAPFPRCVAQVASVISTYEPFSPIAHKPPSAMRTPKDRETDAKAEVLYAHAPSSFLSCFPHSQPSPSFPPFVVPSGEGAVVGGAGGQVVQHRQGGGRGQGQGGGRRGQADVRAVRQPQGEAGAEETGVEAWQGI